MKEPRICGVLTEMNLTAVSEAEQYVDLYEMRIDMIGNGWQDLVTHLKKPWVACNRAKSEGGQWQGTEANRIALLLEASRLGAYMVDVELATAGLSNIVPEIRTDPDAWFHITISKVHHQ